MPQNKKWKTREEHLEERRAYWQTYYEKNRDIIRENHRSGGIYAKTNNTIEYKDASMEKPPKKERTRRPPKTPLQRKRERIARDLEEVEKRASAFRLKLSQERVNEEIIESIETTTKSGI